MSFATKHKIHVALDSPHIVWSCSPRRMCHFSTPFILTSAQRSILGARGLSDTRISACQKIINTLKIPAAKLSIKANCAHGDKATAQLIIKVNNWKIGHDALCYLNNCSFIANVLVCFTEKVCTLKITIK